MEPIEAQALARAVWNDGYRAIPTYPEDYQRVVGKYPQLADDVNLRKEVDEILDALWRAFGGF